MDSLLANFAIPNTMPYTTIASRIAWSSRWYRVRQDDIVFPNGQHGVYNVIEHPGAAYIIPVTADKQIALIRHYRYTVDDWLLEIPAGSLQPGKTHVETAAAELKEEIGGVAREMVEIGRYYALCGICNMEAVVFLATGVELGEVEREASEVMEIVIRPIPAVLDMARDGRITDAQSALALLRAESALHDILNR
ncbi:MAG: NUDIX hydrolase [Anaerolineae bacterium]|nr:NUDIX hydrolase [Anaerolineae bacterium]MCO5189881.1 NUDIX hydrolase [Anaerolineae bacterium]MCO5192339.1 NUDIX hydrolase [Anaerolineae bacterium]